MRAQTVISDLFPDTYSVTYFSIGLRGPSKILFVYGSRWWTLTDVVVETLHVRSDPPMSTCARGVQSRPPLSTYLCQAHPDDLDGECLYRPPRERNPTQPNLHGSSSNPQASRPLLSPSLRRKNRWSHYSGTTPTSLST